MCKTLNVSETATTTQENADLKFQRGGSKWHQLSYGYNISLNFWLPKDKPSQSLYKTILVRHDSYTYISVHTLKQKIDDSLVI